MAIISQYQVVIPGQTITAALWNAMELNIINNGLIPGGIEDLSPTDADYQTRVDPFPGSAISRPTSLEGELHRIRWQLDNIIGKTYWYEDPDVDIATLKIRFDAHTHDGTANNGPQLTSSGLASNSVTTAKITDSNVTTAKLADSAVATVKIETGAVTNDKLGASAVTGDKISATYTISSRPAFLAYNSTGRSNVTGNSVIYVVPYDAEVYDQGSNYNNSTYTFTAPVTGTYLFHFGVSLTGLQTTTHTVTALKLETTSRNYWHHISDADGMYAANLCLSFTDFAKMTAGDTALVKLQVNSGNQDVNVIDGDGSAIGDSTFFGGVLLF